MECPSLLLCLACLSLCLLITASSPASPHALLSEALSQHHCPSSPPSRWTVVPLHGPLFSSLRTSRFRIPSSTHASRLSAPLSPFLSNSKGASGIGTLFLTSADGAYVLKTLSDRERKELEDLLPAYATYMHSEKGKNSLLTRFVGLYDVYEGPAAAASSTSSSSPYVGVLSRLLPTPSVRRRTVVVMNSVFPLSSSSDSSPSSCRLVERYDLKGSTVGRRSLPPGRSLSSSPPPSFALVLKDVDLLSSVSAELSSPEASSLIRAGSWGLHVGPSRRTELLNQLKADVGFLTDNRRIDYSLLVGVRLTGEKSEEGGGASSPLAVSSSSSRTAGSESKKSSTSSSSSVSSSSSPAARVPLLLRLLRNAVRRLLSLPLRLVPYLRTCRIRAQHIMSRLSSSLAGLLSPPSALRCHGGGGPLAVLPGTRLGRPCEYYFGVIDFLQPWTAAKRLERTVKGAAGYDVGAISCAEPGFYGRRFLAFVESNVS